MKAYRILSFTEEVTVCGCCGKSNLKGTYAMLDNATGDITYFGRTCGAKAAGWMANEMNKQLKADVAEQKKLAYAELEQTPEAKFYREYVGSKQHGQDIKEKGFDYVFDLFRPYDQVKKAIQSKYHLAHL